LTFCKAYAILRLLAYKTKGTDITMTEKLLNAPTPELALPAPTPELALPAGPESALPPRPDYADKPDSYLKTSIDYHLHRAQMFGVSLVPEDAADKAFSEDEAVRVQALLDARTKQD
jgi:hypothetical protein